MQLFNRFGLYKALAAIEASTLAESTALVAIMGPISPVDALDAGRLLQRVWLQVSAGGYAGHPFYVLSDLAMRFADGKVSEALQMEAKKTVRQAAHFFGEERGVLHCLMRLGMPISDGEVSSRLSLEELTCKGIRSAQ